MTQRLPEGAGVGGRKTSGEETREVRERERDRQLLLTDCSPECTVRLTEATPYGRSLFSD